MHIDVITIFPELFEPFFEMSLLGRARREGLLEFEAHDLRDYAENRHRSVDDEAYGGGGGMVLTAPPLLRAVRALQSDNSTVALLSPQGQRLEEKVVRRLASFDHLILICGRYEGVDERVRELVVDLEISIGDYVLSGGEVAAMVVIEALSRQIPGVVGLQSSVDNDSFREGILDYPHYTRPPLVEGLAVPEVLRSGDHGAIAAWRHEQALRATREKRPDLLAEKSVGGDGLERENRVDSGAAGLESAGRTEDN